MDPPLRHRDRVMMEARVGRGVQGHPGRGRDRPVMAAVLDHLAP